MAAIDKTYVNNWEDWKEITDWMKSFERVLQNGSILIGENFLYYPDATKEEIESWLKEQKEIPVMNTSWSMDYFFIRECPIEAVQNRMKSVYSKESYEEIKNGTSEYDKFVRPVGGKHLKLIKKPKYYKPSKFLWNGKIRKDRFVVDIELPNGDYSWYYDEIDYWSMPYELIAGGFMSSADVYCKTHKALIRKILKWNLPIGTKVKASHFRFQGGYCEYVIKK
ncbi:MAG: hypothetical protein J1F35_08735 [Erysipelotrichales bacterium]|nr:hypothetical protein [Erysipelotrichales bacterium]